MSNREEIIKKSVQLFKKGKSKKALKILDKEAKSNNYEICYIKGLIYISLNEIQKARHYFYKANELRKSESSCIYNLSRVLIELGEYKESIKYANELISIDPLNKKYWLTLGEAYLRDKNFQESLNSFKRATELDPHYLEALINIGATYNELGNYEVAIDYFNKALAIQPINIRALNNKSIAQKNLNDIDGALQSLNLITDANLTDVEPLINKASIYSKISDQKNELLAFSQAFNLNKDYPYLFGDYLFAKMKTCSWENIEILINNIKLEILANKKVSTPFNLLCIIEEPSYLLKNSQVWAEKHIKKIDPCSKIEINVGEKIKIGYFSPDFRTHAVSFLTAELYELHDRDRFEIYGFYFGPETSDPIHTRIKNSFDYFYSYHDWSSERIIQFVRSLKIDIAVDLCGYTHGSRPEIFLSRVCPIQINYLGYPSTMGSSSIDYIICDEHLIPKSKEKYYQEKPLRLSCFQINDSKKNVKNIYSRSDFGLPEQSFIYCCFNNSFKITPSIFKAWLAIINKVPNSILWIIFDNDIQKINLINFASENKFDISKIFFSEKISPEKNLSRYFLADAFLDTYPYNGGTITSEALFCGLPVVTLEGLTYSSRMGSSILKYVGLENLVAHSIDEYIYIAARVGSDKNYLDNLKSIIAPHKISENLYNSKKFVRELESAYIKLLN